MSERTQPALAKLDEFRPLLKALPVTPASSRLVEETEALVRAVSAFHMEAIRFRMHSIDRLLKQAAGSFPEPVTRIFAEVRHALEAAGFHTRSQSAP